MGLLAQKSPTKGLKGLENPENPPREKSPRGPKGRWGGVLESGGGREFRPPNLRLVRARLLAHRSGYNRVTTAEYVPHTCLKLHRGATHRAGARSPPMDPRQMCNPCAPPRLSFAQIAA